MKKHWRTTGFGIVCFILATCGAVENIQNGAFNIHRLWESMHFWYGPLALYACSFIGFHAADHKNMPK